MVAAEGKWYITPRFRLRKNDYNFPCIAAQLPSCVVTGEVMEDHGDDTLTRPVGTCPILPAEFVHMDNAPRR